jgi:antitoxin (DNA-binding transcriptional repressor) of toxin-antitoxin stability system
MSAIDDDKDRRHPANDEDREFIDIEPEDREPRHPVQDDPDGATEPDDAPPTEYQRTVSAPKHSAPPGDRRNPSTRSPKARTQNPLVLPCALTNADHRTRKDNHFRSDESKARALRNLRPWRPGRSPNPAGRKPNGGLSIVEWINEMQDWPLVTVKALVTNTGEPVNKIVAAKLWVHACSEKKCEAGADRIFDRTLGKPKQAMEIGAKDGKSIQQYNLSLLTIDDLRSLRQILAKAAVRLPDAENTVF